jgi:hypothetical protein
VVRKELALAKIWIVGCHKQCFVRKMDKEQIKYTPTIGGRGAGGTFFCRPTTSVRKATNVADMNVFPSPT